jgi:hypothetical protein
MSAPGHDVEVPWTLPALRREWNRAKDQVAPWWRANSKEAYNSGLDALARALKNWSDSKAGRRKGPKVGFPQFKGKHRTRPACRFTTGPIRLEPDRHHVILPRLGRIRTHESTRKLARRHGPRASNGTRRTPSAGWQHTKQRLARGRTHALRTSAATAFTSSPATSPVATTRSWSSTSTSRECSTTGAWPAASPTRAGGSCAASSRTRRSGRVRGWSKQTRSTRPARPARPVGQ